MNHILIVEDEKAISNLIRLSLSKEGYACTCAYDGIQAADLIEKNRYDLILLDIMLPGFDEVEKIAVETISYIGADNMARGELVVTPVLFVGTDENSAVQSGVFWCCRWTDSDAQSQVLWLDDESGLMVGLMFENYLYDGSSDDSLSESYTDVPESIDLLVKYCRMYYSADNVEINNEWDGNYSIILTKEQNGVKSVYPISVRLQNNELIFFNV